MVIPQPMLQFKVSLLVICAIHKRDHRSYQSVSSRVSISCALRRWVVMDLTYHVGLEGRRKGYQSH